MTNRRAGGRAARKALRAAPLAEDSKPVRPGQSGGRFLPLTADDIARIDQAAFDLLENVGFSRAIPSCIELVTRAGGRHTDDGRLLFPRWLVEQALEQAARDITLHAQTPECDLHLSGNKVYFGTAGAAVHVVDDWKTHAQYPGKGAYRESTLQDLYDAARLVDHLEHIHFFQRCMVARDIEDPRAMDLNTTYASVAGTRKHCGVSYVDAAHAEEGLKLLHRIAGGESKWRARPFASVSCCFVVPPLRFAEDACKVLEVCVRGGMPVLLLAAGQAGATSPASLAGAVAQECAECLGALVYVNLITPGHPAIFGPWPFVSDLRTGAMSGGSGEQAVLMAACGQMGRHYDLPTGIAAGMADSKIPDAQSGGEKGYTLGLAGHSGANMVYEAAGMQGSLLGFSFEGALIDNDVLGAVNRSVRGIETDADSLAVRTITEVCIGGPEHFLGHDATLSRMQRDYVYPEVGNRLTPAEWQELGGHPVNIPAREKTREILSAHFPAHINDATDAKLREEFDIRLPRGVMKAGGV
ncbi:MAG: trimethylamine methyltransferase family protein [Gammaproteobacteria bacterium]|nr:trimethylamine methyltransferase family protein [Gammaproteobacteria bacterium]MDD9822105.1 trimethylamine methyltransferase family protein [Gammaproteobacteria bacterium]MDD9884217.1 trimethylamine methyltransferase family protein [Gammaproteobacteria bacterium]